MKVVADGDSIAYAAAFSTQYQTYQLEGEGVVFRYYKDCQDWLSLNFDVDERPEPIKVQVLEPLNYSFHIINKMVEGIKTDTQAQELIIYLSGENNFRKSIKYPVEYKGGRPEKPVHLPEIREYLVNKYSAVIVDGYEADDAIGIFATENPGCVIASIDKDLRMIPGNHFHLKNKNLEVVTELEGLRSFYAQMLTGDRVDNIIGVEKIGEKTAQKLLNHIYSEKDMDKIVRQKYKECFKDDWEIMYKSNFLLLKILTSKAEYEEIRSIYGKK